MTGEIPTCLLDNNSDAGLIQKRKDLMRRERVTDQMVEAGLRELRELTNPEADSGLDDGLQAFLVSCIYLSMRQHSIQASPEGGPCRISVAEVMPADGSRAIDLP
jgi:hypothetical protein